MPNELSAPEQHWIRNTGCRVYIHVYIHMIIYWKSVSVLFPRSLKAVWPAKNSGPVWDGGRGKSLMLLASNNKSQSYLPPCLIKYLEKKILWLIRLLHWSSIDYAPFCCPGWVSAKWWQSRRNKWLAIAGAETKTCQQNTKHGHVAGGPCPFVLRLPLIHIYQPTGLKIFREKLK